jgi:hypothetical protein
VNAWAKSDAKLEDWRIPIQPTLEGRTPGETTIRFTDLRTEVKMRLREGNIHVTLARSVSQAYAFFLERYVRVSINGVIVEPIPVPIGESAEISPARATVKTDGVTMRFFASLIAPKSEWKQERAGWYVLCNGRVVLPADKSEVTGWGGLRLPIFHSKYTGFIGIALLESSDPLKLPWSTTKRGLNRESPIYQAALREIVSISKPILAFLSRMYSSEPEENKAEREVAERVKATNLSALASRGDAAFATKQKKAGKPTVRVQYDAEKGELDRVRKRVRNPELGANHIGRLTLDYYLRVECSE